MSNAVAIKSARRRQRRARVLKGTAPWTPWAFVAPAVFMLFVITMVPFLIEIWLSLNSVELTRPAPPQFVGLKNFADVILADGRFWNAMRITFTLIAAAVGLQLVLGTVLALLLNRLRRSRSLITSLFLIPVMIAPVVSGMMWVMIYDDKFGPLNYLIRMLSGGLVRPAAWVADPGWALASIMVADIWQWTPFIIMLVLAGLQSIPPEMYEAGEVDGAGPWQGFRYITVPMLLPVLVIGVLIRFMDSFKIFDLVYLITRGGPGSATETISFYTYIRGFKQFSVGYTAAMAFVQLIVIIAAAKLFVGYLNRRRGEAG